MNMDRLQKIQLRQSEVRQEIGAILDCEEVRSEEDNKKLKALGTEARQLEGDYQAASLISKEPLEVRHEEVDGEGREFEKLRDTAKLSNYMTAFVEQRSVTGAEKELQEHYGLSGNMLPWDALETRAVTPAPSDVGRNQRAIIPYKFPRSVSAYLGVPNPTVPVGESGFSVVTTAPTVRSPAKNASAADTTGSFSASVLSPARLQASFFYAVEDRAKFAGMEEALRQSLNQALGSALDQKVIDQFSATSGGLSNPTNPTAEASYATYLSELYSQVDGRYADSAASVRMLVNGNTYQHMSGLYRTTNSNENSAETIGRVGGGLRVSSLMPATASTIATAIFARDLVDTHMVAPTWQGIQIIRDEVTLSAKGQVQITAIMLYAVSILRTEGFGRVEFKTS